MFMKKPTFSEHVNVKSLCVPLTVAQHKNSGLVSKDFDKPPENSQSQSCQSTVLMQSTARAGR